MAQLGSIPVYLRVGTGSEFRIGDLTADGQAQPNGDVRLVSPWPGDVSSLLRAVADEIPMPEAEPASIVELELARRALLEAEIDHRSERHARAWADVYAAAIRDA
jgi:hypothetical protein